MGMKRKRMASKREARSERSSIKAAVQAVWPNGASGEIETEPTEPEPSRKEELGKPPRSAERGRGTRTGGTRNQQSQRHPERTERPRSVGTDGKSDTMGHKQTGGKGGAPQAGEIATPIREGERGSRKGGREEWWAWRREARRARKRDDRTKDQTRILERQI